MGGGPECGLVPCGEDPVSFEVCAPVWSCDPIKRLFNLLPPPPHFPSTQLPRNPMALITDPTFLIHQMRVKYMRIDDRVAERILTFSPTTMTNDYIKTAAPVYPEMQYAYSPTYHHNDNFLSGGAAGRPALTSTPSFGKPKSLAYGGRRKKEVQVVPPPTHTRDNDKSSVDSDDEIDIEEDESVSGSGKPRPPIFRKISGLPNNKPRKSSAPALFVTAPSKPPDSSQQLSAESFSPTQNPLSSPGDLMSPRLIMVDSVSPSPSAQIDPYSLIPSVDSTTDPTPKTSPEIEPSDAVSDAAKSHPGTEDHDVDDLTPFSSPGGTGGMSTIAPNPILPLPPLPTLRLANLALDPLNATTREGFPQTQLSQLVAAHHDRTTPLANPSGRPLPLTPTRSRSTPTSNLPSTTSSFSTPTSRPHAASSPAAPILPQQLKPRSALTALIAEKKSAAENPFAAEFSFHSGKGEPSPMTLCVYTPYATTPKEPMTVVVKRECSVEDVIGYALYQYMDEKREPGLKEELWDINLWVLRIAEDDGEIEEDLPAVDRSQRIAKVSFDQFALCEATPAQGENHMFFNCYRKNANISKKGRSHPHSSTSHNIHPASGTFLVKLNEQLHAKLMKTRPPPNYGSSAVLTTLPTNPSSTTTNLASTAAATNNSTLAAASAAAALMNPVTATLAAPAMTASSSAQQPSNSQQPPPASAAAVPVPSSKSTLTKSTLTNPVYQYLRVRLMTSQEVAATMTVAVYADMFLGDVLDLLCRKRKLDPNLYVLKFPDSNLIVPLDSTVESLHGVQEMTLVKKMAGLTAPSSSSHIWRSPSRKRADLYQPMYSPNPSSSNEGSAYMSQYKKYIVNRKMPVFVGRRESTLAIDGDYVHIMPPENKGMFEMKTSSYHISAVESCKQSKKVPTNFKLVAVRDRDQKSYDLEAETPKEASELALYGV
ncbi:stress-activated map kinase interacting protein 1-domain-containing protein [Jimgerdemannia flammicorona]|uniref:Stress-activated map kinase interacting protein 1-domain-containing protein n=1 Tax=Jimgerdemannia flammicorona TaxID=994334 RepID=A0A433D4B6_9FUNG|nr:stress-activated map kinase interacting protein 1-domain-containing protein [Jimgerdemannia flammicorona]